MPVDTLPQTADTSDTTLETTASTNEEPVYPLSPERKEKLISYSKFNNLWRFADFFIGVAILSLVLFTGWSAKMRTFAQKARYKFFVWWLYFILISIALYIINFPVDYYREYVVEVNYGFMNQTFGEWFIDSLKTLGLSLLLGIIPVWLFYFILERSSKWWLWFSLGTIPILILLVVIAPVFLAPVFNDFSPLKDKELESKILSLASTAGIEGSDVFEVDASKQSSKINAYVTGLFNTKRIVLYDTIIKNFEDDEILFVMGHEMGHYVMNHIWQGLALAVAVIMLSLWLTNKMVHGFISRFQSKLKFERFSDVASLPLALLFLTVISFFSQPISNTFSRHMEHQADIYGMEITDVSGNSAAIAFDKLSAFNLSDPDPHPIIEFWFYSHPSLSKRMQFVRHYRTQDEATDT
jgi:Zn-dependent protease with chaperone function